MDCFSLPPKSSRFRVSILISFAEPKKYHSTTSDTSARCARRKHETSKKNRLLDLPPLHHGPIDNRAGKFRSAKSAQMRVRTRATAVCTGGGPRCLGSRSQTRKSRWTFDALDPERELHDVMPSRWNDGPLSGTTIACVSRLASYRDRRPTSQLVPRHRWHTISDGKLFLGAPVAWNTPCELQPLICFLGSSANGKHLANNDDARSSIYPAAKHFVSLQTLVYYL